MNEDFYTLQWRGRKTEPMSLQTIREALEMGDIHSMYQIEERGRWRLLRDFLEERSVAKLYRSNEGSAGAGYEAAAWEQPPERTAVPPPMRAAGSGPGQSRDFALQDASEPAADSSRMPPIHSAHAKTSAGKFPTWLTATLIGLIVIILPVGGLGAYLLFRAPAQSDALPKTAAGTDAAAAVATDPAGDLSIEELMAQKARYVVQVNAVWQGLSETGELETAGGTGSGVHLANKDGHAIFVTNLHVVQPPPNAQKWAHSIFFEGEELPCEVVGVARHEIDLAKIRVKLPEAKDGEVLNMVPMDALKVGQECVAIGSPLGEGISITSGIISRFDEFPHCKMVRTSAPISPGNSGGGLFRKKDGALIGITTASMEGRGHAQNFNLAIPVDYILNDLFWQPFKP